MSYIGRSGEEQRSPFSAVLPLGEDLFDLPLPRPCFQMLILANIGSLQLPFDVAPSVTTDPLPIEIDIQVDIKVAGDVGCYICCR